MSQPVRELQPFGVPLSKTASSAFTARTGTTVLEPAFTPRPYNMAPTVKVASQPVPQLTTGRVPATHTAQAKQAQAAQAQAQTKIASTNAPAGASPGEPNMTQLNQAKLASGIGVLDTLAGRQIDPSAYIKQASASNNPALQASADDAYYALAVADQAPDVFNRAYEMVMWGVKQASLGSKAVDVASEAPPALLRTGARDLQGELNMGLPPAAVNGGGVSPDIRASAELDEFSAFSPYSPGGGTSGMGQMIPEPDRALATVSRGSTALVPTRGRGAPPNVSFQPGVLDRASRWARRNPYAAGGAALAGTAALGGGGYATYEGLRDRPWYEQLANAAGM